MMTWKEALNLTHFVRIALVTRASLPQILRSYSRIQKDTISTVIPQGAFTHPANLHLTLGSLSLPTPSDLVAALEIIRSAIARQDDHPFTVHVVGIGKSLVSREPRDLSRTLRLYSRIEDPTNTFHKFCQRVRTILRDEGLLRLDPLVQSFQIPFHTRLLDTNRLDGDSVNDKHPRFLRPRIDATDIHRKYKDFVLMKDVQLEELHISKIGLKKVLYEDVLVAGYRNIATVPLPGAARNVTKPLQTELGVSIPVYSPS